MPIVTQTDDRRDAPMLEFYTGDHVPASEATPDSPAYCLDANGDVSRYCDAIVAAGPEVGSVFMPGAQPGVAPCSVLLPLPEGTATEISGEWAFVVVLANGPNDHEVLSVDDMADGDYQEFGLDGDDQVVDGGTIMMAMVRVVRPAAVLE